LLADVDADGFSDVVALRANAEVHVALKAETGFTAPRRWHAGFCSAAEECRAGDVNADGLADLVSFVRDGIAGMEGDVRVSLSNGVDFGPPERWATGVCRGAQGCALADVNGDGRSDAIVFSGPAPGSGPSTCASRSPSRSGCACEGRRQKP
jgi:hypothetical protein